MSRFSIKLGPTMNASEVRYDGVPLEGVEMVSVHADVNSGLIRATISVFVNHARVETRRGAMFTTVGGKRYMLVEETLETPAEEQEREA